MKKFFISTPIILATVLVFFNCTSGQKSQSTPQKIIIIRHGEKPDKGDNLSCEGLNRSLQLPDVLYKKFGVPNTIFVPSLDMGRSTNGARMYQTVVPFAVKYNLKIDTKYDADDVKGIADDIQKQTGTVLLVWEHKAISKIAKALGVSNVDKWDDNDFDSIWIITYKNGSPVLSKDTEGIRPSSTCP